MESIAQNLETYGYIALFIYSLGGGFVGLIAAGIFASMGHLNIFVVVIVAFVANTLGDTALFFISRSNKQAVLDYFRKHRRKIALTHLLMRRQGSWILIGQKFVYGLKTIVPLAVGWTKYSAFRFTILNIIGAFLWAIVFGFGSFYASDFFAALAERYENNLYVMPLALIAVFVVIIAAITVVSRKKRNG
ncbi:MAG: DedA family protein [Helicobacteraceae bacterium]|nr:DedA family protein [Helicobacteraceae bacterium]